MPPTGHTIALVGVAHRTDRADLVGRVRVEHRGEPRDAALDDLLVDDVGLRRRPHCGSASCVLSTFTVSAGRVGDAPVGSTTPVSGAMIGAAVVVVVGFGRAAVARRLPRRRRRRRHARERRAPTRRRARSDSEHGSDRGTSAVLEIGVVLHRLERGDAVVERRVRGEQAVQRVADLVRSRCRAAPRSRGARSPSTRCRSTVVSSLSFFERRDRARAGSA